jgi:alpha-mannosidase
MHEVKQLQHRGERLLEQAEAFANAFCANGSERSASLRRIDTAWEDLAFTQFHDILAGTSIPVSYLSTRHFQGRAGIVAEEEIVRITRLNARRELTPENVQRLVLMHGGSAPFEGCVECEPFIDFDDWNDRWLADETGAPVPFQLICPEANTGPMIHRIVLQATIPPQGRRVLQIRHGDAPQPPASVAVPARLDGHRLASGDLAVELSPSGFRSLKWKGCECLGPEGISLHLRADHGDTWAFHQTAFEEEITARLGGLEWITEDEGPLRVRLFADQSLGDSKLRIGVVLYAGLPEIHVHLEVVFAERFKLLQMPIQLASPPEGWISGLAGGMVVRHPGHDEMPFCGWDSVQIPGCSLGLHTQDAFSSSLRGDIWQFSLLRSPLMAWTGDSQLPAAMSRRHSDQGWHSFDFILRVDNAFDAARSARVSDHQAMPPVAFDYYAGMNRPAWCNAPPRRLWTPDIPHARLAGHMRHLDGIADLQGGHEEEKES